MDDELQGDQSVSKSSECDNHPHPSVVERVQAVSHNRLLTYALIIVALMIGSIRYEQTQRNHLRDSEQRGRAELCHDINVVKQQANQRIRILRTATKKIAFVSKEGKAEIERLANQVHPIPMRDCSPIRP